MSQSLLDDYLDLEPSIVRDFDAWFAWALRRHDPAAREEHRLRTLAAMGDVIRDAMGQVERDFEWACMTGEWPQR